jgi:hypothetical protein
MDFLQYDSKLTKAPFALWITEASKLGFLEFKGAIEEALGETLTHEHFIGLLLNNKDWIVERIREQCRMSEYLLTKHLDFEVVEKSTADKLRLQTLEDKGDNAY